MVSAIRDALSGITCPIVTPFADGSVDEEAYVDVLDHVVAGGIDAIFPCGTTGEFASLSAEERERLISITVEETSVPVLAGAAATSIDETVATVEAAAAAGADAAAIVPPYFHTASESIGNQRFFEAVLDRTDLPLVLYNIPQCTGRRIDPETVAAIGRHDRVLGIKDSSGDFAYHLQLIADAGEEYLVLQGYDALLVPALRMGGDGGINALSNVFPGILQAAYDAVVDADDSEQADENGGANDDRARTLQERGITPLFDVCGTYDFAPTTKTALVHREVIPTDEVRPPLVSVDDPTAVGEPIDRILEAVGVDGSALK